MNTAILWYVEHKNEVLAYQDRFLAEIDTTLLYKMHRKTKRKWLDHLEKVRAAFDREKALPDRRQTTLDRFFGL